jgi:hypothetical protein
MGCRAIMALIPPCQSTFCLKMPLPQSSSVAPAQAATLSLASVIESIDNGDAIVILNRDVLRLNSWLSYHPGGEKAILHLVGRDATDEVNSWVYCHHLL